MSVQSSRNKQEQLGESEIARLASNVNALPSVQRTMVTVHHTPPISLLLTV